MAGIRRSLPGKCFLFGEYSVLDGGPAILVTLPPEFEISARPGKGLNPFNPHSPAGILWNSDPSFFSQWEIEFLDPYLGAGGFGRSTAEFGLLFSLYENPNEAPLNPFEAAWYAFTKYRQVTFREKNPPSGADLLAQVARRPPGMILYADLDSKIMKDLAGIPSDLDIFLVRSGEKVATHTHLDSLADEAKKIRPELLAIIHEAEMLLTGHKEGRYDNRSRGVSLGDLFTRYGSLLEGAGLVTEKAKENISALRKITGVLGAKGCGAMGADIYVAALFHSDKARFLKGVK
jgi:hypothetical protein